MNFHLSSKKHKNLSPETRKYLFQQNGRKKYKQIAIKRLTEGNTFRRQVNEKE